MLTGRHVQFKCCKTLISTIPSSLGDKFLYFDLLNSLRVTRPPKCDHNWSCTH